MVPAPDIPESPSRREREKAMHRKAIIDAATVVFAEKGFHAATLDEIAQRAEFSKGALYLYFSSKEDLLYNILNDAFTEWTTEFSSIISSNRTFREELTEIFCSTARLIDSNPALTSLMSAQNASLFLALSEDRRNQMIEQHLQFWDTLTGRIQRAIDAGELRNIPPENVRGMIHGSLDSMITSRWDCICHEQLENNAIPAFMDILFHGIAAPTEAH